MKILILGGSGQLGCELQKILHDGCAELGALPQRYTGAEVFCPLAAELDIIDKAAVEAYVGSHSFDLVINAAAFTHVDGCEEQEDVAYQVNGLAPGYIASACEACGAAFVQVSTDYVFRGDDPKPRLETDMVDPISAYGRTKRAGEQNALAGCTACFVVRTAWLYGSGGNNFVQTMLRLGKTHHKVSVVDDQWGNPTSAHDLAYEILVLATTKNYGIYHVTNKGTCSWADFAEAIFEGSGLDCQVVRCSSQDYAAKHPHAARRPAYSSLRNKHLEDTVGDEMGTWQDALTRYLNH